MAVTRTAPRDPSRRRLLLGATALLAVPLPAGAEEDVLDLAWEHLLPGEADDAARPLRELGVVAHGDLATGFEQPEATGITTRYDGRVVRLSGFVVPIDFDGTGVTAFILVPYVGACVHVPPPPANQLVLVTTERAYEIGSQWEPVTVTGVFGAAATATQLAQIGYVLSADRIEPYEG